jgi:hypothetical protein
MHTLRTTADVRGFLGSLREFLGAGHGDLDAAFEDVRIDVARSVWSVGGVVRGTHRVTPIGGPASSRHMALGVGLVADVADRDSADGGGDGTRVTVESGAGHLRVTADDPGVVLGVLPLTGAASDTARALSDAGLPIEVHGPDGPLGVLDRDGRTLVAASS